ncbi:MAG: DUF4364 family protein [archaeon]
MRKRGRLEIIHDILRALQDKGSLKPTHILYKSNLSYQMLTEYLTELIGKQLISEYYDKRGNKLYSITDKGHGFLKDFRIIKSFMESYGLD